MINLENCPRNDNFHVFVIYFLFITWNSHINIALCVKVCLTCSFQLAKIRCISNARIPLLFPIRYKLLHFEQCIEYQYLMKTLSKWSENAKCNI